MFAKRNLNGKNKAFTLIELLVVISIIALLLSILMPSLQRAKEGGMRAVCLSNQHQLVLAWATYASSSDDKIVNGNTRNGAGDITLPPGVNGWVLWTPIGEPPLTAVPLDPEPGRGFSAFGQIVEDQLDCIKGGDLYSYCESFKAYKCPVGRRGNERTYSIVDSMNGWDPGSWPNPVGTPNPLIYRNINKIKDGSRKLVFLDCGEQSYASWTQGPMATTWMEPIASRHGEGSTFSFADGHAEHRKWEHRYTKLLGELSIHDYFWGPRHPDLVPGSNWNCVTSSDVTNDPNPDFIWIHKGMWGKAYTN